MLLTVTNTSGVAIAAGDLPHPFQQYALAIGVNFVSPTSEEDLRYGEDKGAPSYKAINLLIATGVITIAASAPGTGDTLTGLIAVMEEATTV